MKLTSNPVGETKVRDFVSAADYTFQVKEKWFFTTGYFSWEARNFAKKANVTLVELEDRRGRTSTGTQGLIEMSLKAFKIPSSNHKGEVRHTETKNVRIDDGL